MSKSRWSRLCECRRQAETEVLSNSRNKIHQTCCTDFSRSLYLFGNLHNFVHNSNRPLFTFSDGEHDDEGGGPHLRGVRALHVPGGPPPLPRQLEAGQGRARAVLHAEEDRLRRAHRPPPVGAAQRQRRLGAQAQISQGDKLYKVTK